MIGQFSHNSANYSLTKWIYVVARIFGYWPFTVDVIDPHHLNSMQVNAANWIWLSITVLIYIACILLQYTSQSLNYRFSATEILLTRATTVVYGLIPIGTIALNLYNRLALRNIHMINLEFDQKVSALNRIRWPIAVICVMIEL